MAKNYKRDGQTIDHTPVSAVAAGTLVLIGGVAALVLADIPAGETGAALAEGVVQLPAVSSGAIAQGVPAYITGAGNVTGTASGNTLIGRMWAAKADGVAVAEVKLNVP